MTGGDLEANGAFIAMLPLGRVGEPKEITDAIAFRLAARASRRRSPTRWPSSALTLEALLQIVGVLNRPQGDNLILTRAGVSLDTALFPLLVRVSTQRNLTIGELADQVGRDCSTVSRQITRLQALGLVHTEPSETDRRQRLLSVTTAGTNSIKRSTAPATR